MSSVSSVFPDNPNEPVQITLDHVVEIVRKLGGEWKAFDDGLSGRTTVDNSRVEFSIEDDGTQLSMVAVAYTGLPYNEKIQLALSNVCDIWHRTSEVLTASTVNLNDNVAFLLENAVNIKHPMSEAQLRNVISETFEKTKEFAFLAELMLNE